MNNAKYIERYQQLIRVLETLPARERRKQFDMNRWGHITECGTKFCAAGFCGLDLWFRRQGFHTSIRLGINTTQIVPAYRKKESWSAIHAFFGADADRVFEDPITVAEVIKAAKERIAELKKGLVK